MRLHVTACVQKFTCGSGRVIAVAARRGARADGVALRAGAKRDVAAGKVEKANVVSGEHAAACLRDVCAVDPFRSVEGDGSWSALSIGTAGCRDGHVTNC